MDEALQALALLHQEVDAAATELARAHGARLQCKRGCASCCVDDLTVFEVEAERIVRAHPEVVASTPHPAGGCAFLDDDGACRVYEVRPYVCRTQGLPLRWIDEDEAGAPVEYRDICELNEEGGDPLPILDEGRCWTIGPYEGRLAALQAKVDGGQMRRITLRSLFSGPGGCY